jgi:hypothetical protein
VDDVSRIDQTELDQSVDRRFYMAILKIETRAVDGSLVPGDGTLISRDESLLSCQLLLRDSIFPDQLPVWVKVEASVLFEGLIPA